MIGSTQSAETVDWQLIEPAQSAETVDGELIETFQSAQTVDGELIGKNDKKQMILDFVASNTETTSSQIVNLTKLSPTRVRELLKELVADDAVEKIGNYRYTKYRVKKIV